MRMLRRMGFACLLLLLLLQGSAAWAAPEVDREGAEALLQAFPLDPTGERVEVVAPERRGRSEAVRALREPAEASAGSSRTALVLAASIAAGLLLVVGGLVTVRGGRRPNGR
jgi:hypothetical protein